MRQAGCFWNLPPTIKFPHSKKTRNTTDSDWILVHCNRPPVPVGMQIFLVGATGRWPFEAGHILPTHGAAVEYACLESDGKRIEGPRLIFCVEGRWSPPEIPRCVQRTHDVIPDSWIFYRPWERYTTHKRTIFPPVLFIKIVIFLLTTRLCLKMSYL